VARARLPPPVARAAEAAAAGARRAAGRAEVALASLARPAMAPVAPVGRGAYPEALRLGGVVPVGACGVPLCGDCPPGGGRGGHRCAACGAAAPHAAPSCPAAPGAPPPAAGPDSRDFTAAAVVLAARRGRAFVLLQKRSRALGGTWAFPSGLVKQCLLRDPPPGSLAPLLRALPGGDPAARDAAARLAAMVAAAREEAWEEAGVDLRAAAAAPWAVFCPREAGGALSPRHVHADAFFALRCEGPLPRCDGPLPQHAWEIGDPRGHPESDLGLPRGSVMACRGHAWVPVTPDLPDTPGLWHVARHTARRAVAEAGAVVSACGDGAGD